MGARLYRYANNLPFSDDHRRHLEEIPGVRVYGATVVAPENAAWLLEDRLRDIGATARIVARPPPQRAWLPDDLARITELRPWVPAYLTAYQRAGILRALGHEGWLLAWPTGAGKTLAGTVWSLAEPGPVLVITKAANRRSFALDVEKHTTVKPLVMVPASERKKSDPAPVVDPLAPPRMVIVAWESLADFQEQLLALAPVSVVLDEIHMCGKSGKRYEKIPVVTEDGQDAIEFRRLDNRASAAERITRNCKRRLGLSATPIPDRVRDLWAPLDLLDPRGFGPRWRRRDGTGNGFYNRYADAHENNFGAMDTRGRSNVRELVGRLKFVMHVVDYATTHHDLPPKRRQISYLPKGQQDRPAAFAKELQQAMKVESPGLRKYRVNEVRAAEAASRKRTSIIDRAVSTLSASGKVVLFTGRKADCERLAAALEKAAPKGTQLWHGHGSHTPARRDEIREAYMAAPGPAALVGTMQSWGESLNLHDTDHAIFAMLPVTPRELWQAEGRFARRGMKRPVLIEYVIAEGTVDEQIASLLLEKLPAVEEIQGDSEMAKASRDLASGGLSEEDITERLAATILRPGGEDLTDNANSELSTLNPPISLGGGAPSSIPLRAKEGVLELT